MSKSRPDNADCNVARFRLFRILRNSAIVLGVILIVIAWVTAGISPTLVAESFLQLIASALVAASFALLAAAAMLHRACRRIQDQPGGAS